MTHLHFEAQIYDIIFTQRKSIKNFNRSLTILGGEVVGGASRTGNDGRVWEVVGGVGAVGAVGAVGGGGSGGRAWERWEVRAARAMMGAVGAVGMVGGVGMVGMNYVLWLGGGVFDFIAGLIHSLSDAALL